MSNYNLGRILPIFRGAYQVGTTYNKLDLVYVAGSGTYVAKQTVASLDPTTHPEVWQVVSKDITNAEVAAIFAANEADRDELVAAMIQQAGDDVQEAIQTLTATVNTTLAEVNTTMATVNTTLATAISDFQAAGETQLEEQAETFATAEQQRYATLNATISAIQANDTSFKNTLQSGVNTWLNEREVNFNENMDEWGDEFSAAQGIRANTFNQSQTQRAATFNSTMGEYAATFAASEADRAATFNSTEGAREEATAAIQAEHDNLVTLNTTKADKDGYYAQMGVGTAENLISPDGVIDNNPYIYRTTAGDTSISTGYATLKSIDGNSIVWNQFLNSEDSYPFVVVTGQRIDLQRGIRVEGEGASVRTRPMNSIKNNKYYVSFKIKTDGSYNRTAWNGVFSSSFLPGGVQGINRGIAEALTNNNPSVIYTVLSGSYIELTDYMIIDLTQMFGAGNEPTTVDEFESLFPDDYYEYNAGEIYNVNVNSLKTIGFNQYNNVTGKAKVLKDNQYQISGAYTSITQGADAITPDIDGLFTPSHTGDLTITGGDNTTCVHLTWSGYRNGDYEPYTSNTKDLSWIYDIEYQGNKLFPDGLCSAGNVYDEVTKTHAVKRIGKVDLGSLSWMAPIAPSVSFRVERFNSIYNCKPEKSTTIPFNGINDAGYVIVGSALEPDKTICNQTSVTGRLYLVDSSLTTVDDLKSTLNGKYLYYELATPIVVEFAEPKNMTYFADDFGTEEVIAMTGNNTAPFKAKTFYMNNLRDKIRNIDGNTDAGALMNTSLENLLGTLGTAIGGTFSKTWNSTNSDWEFTFTPDEEEGGME